MKQGQTNDRFRKARLTIQQCSFPRTSPSPRNINHSTTHKKISFAYLSSSIEKKHKECNPEKHLSSQKISRKVREDRNSDQLHHFMERHLCSCLPSLPDIRTSRDEIKKEVKDEFRSSEPMKSYSSAKLTVTPYHKIQSLISTKYSSQMAAMRVHDRKQDGMGRKIITISQINSGPVIDSLKAERSLKLKQTSKKILKSSQKLSLNRARNELHQPQQLVSYKCQQKPYDNDNFNLQLKNVMRFQFDSNHHSGKEKGKKKEDHHERIDGWKLDNENSRTPALFLY